MKIVEKEGGLPLSDKDILTLFVFFLFWPTAEINAPLTGKIGKNLHIVEGVKHILTGCSVALQQMKLYMETWKNNPLPNQETQAIHTNFYCFQRSLSHGADTGHRLRADDMQRGLPLGWPRARALEKVLCNIASNGCLHTERAKPALTDSFNDTQWKLAIKTGDKNKYVNAGGGFSPCHVKRIN